MGENKQGNEARFYVVLALVVIGAGLWLLVNGATVPGIVALMAGIGAGVHAWSQTRSATPAVRD